jgi:hypothetical protein
MRSFAILAVLAVVTPFAVSQRTTGLAHSASHPRPSNSDSVRGHRTHSLGSRRSASYASPYSSLPFPFFADSFNPDDIYSSGYPVASQPPPFLMEAMRGMTGPSTSAIGSAMGSPTSREPSSNQPLMIELQNGRYVRVNNAAVDGEALPINFTATSKPSKPGRVSSTKLATDSTQPLSAQPSIAAAPPGHRLPPALLVFRDGHSEEVRDYTIADGVLYARGDYYTDGYWNKKIDLTSLNVPETLQANASRSVKFVLPSSPNEVITRP